VPVPPQRNTFTALPCLFRVVGLYREWFPEMRGPQAEWERIGQRFSRPWAGNTHALTVECCAKPRLASKGASQHGV
jgi:hypothetical protein